MPAVSQKQRAFIASNPEKFGGLKNALEEWIKPTKGKDLPKYAPKKKK
jgi:hypothetical protein